MYNQKAFIIGKIKSMGIKQVTVNKGTDREKENIVLETTMNIVPCGTYFKVSKMLGKDFIENTEHWFHKKYVEFESMINQFNADKEAGKDVYCTYNVMPSTSGKGKDAKTQMWDMITSSTTPDGTTFFQGSGFINFLPYEDKTVGEDVERIFQFKTKDVNIKDIARPSIEISMIVANENGVELDLTSGGDYPKDLAVVIDESSVGKAQIGQGYKFMVQFEKLAVEDSTAEDDWENEAKPTFGKTILKVKKVLGKVNGYTLDEGFNQDVLGAYV